MHAPYLINVCSPRPNIRYGSRKILQQTCDAAAEVGAAAVIVHAGHAEDGIAAGRRALAADAGAARVRGAGADREHGRRRERGRPPLRRPGAPLGGSSAAYAGPVEVGFCFDTCHAHAAGEELADAVERAQAITGRLDLLHANDSRDPPGTGADRHARLGEGEIDPEALRAMIRAGGELGAPILVETPGPLSGIRADLEFVREALAGPAPAQ